MPIIVEAKDLPTDRVSCNVSLEGAVEIFLY